jgi:hypothetical protein
MESDRYITICSKTSLSSETVLIDIFNKTTRQIPITKIDAALTHPTEPFIAIRGQCFFLFYSSDSLTTSQWIAIFNFIPLMTLLLSNQSHSQSRSFIGDGSPMRSLVLLQLRQYITGLSMVSYSLVRPVLILSKTPIHQGRNS